jgi:hypothetical protein
VKKETSKGERRDVTLSVEKSAELHAPSILSCSKTVAANRCSVKQFVP